jgi:uncharacterized protein YdeI (YjbR/CyaY-like superfamily)
VILVYAKKHTGLSSLDWDEAVEEALCFGWIDGVRLPIDEQHYTLRFTPRKPKSLWSRLNVERFARLRKAGKVHPAGLAAWKRGQSDGQVHQAYAVRDRVPMPPELRAELARNTRARKAYEAITPGQKNSWCRWIVWAKARETRVRRASETLRLILAGRIAGETDAQAAKRGIPSKAKILGL